MHYWPVFAYVLVAYFARSSITYHRASTALTYFERFEEFFFSIHRLKSYKDVDSFGYVVLIVPSSFWPFLITYLFQPTA